MKTSTAMLTGAIITAVLFSVMIFTLTALKPAQPKTILKSVKSNQPHTKGNIYVIPHVLPEVSI